MEHISLNAGRVVDQVGLIGLGLMPRLAMEGQGGRVEVGKGGLKVSLMMERQNQPTRGQTITTNRRNGLNPNAPPFNPEHTQ